MIVVLIKKKKKLKIKMIIILIKYRKYVYNMIYEEVYTDNNSLPTYYKQQQ